MWGWPLAVGAGAGAVALVVTGGASGDAAQMLVGVAVAAVAAAGATFTSIRVTVDRRGLRIDYGPLGWPVTTIALDRIESASVVEDLVPLRWGGWGYRGSLFLAGRAAVVLRRGEAIQLTLVDGKRFLVTVDGASAGAAALDATIGRSPAPGDP